MSHGFMVTVLGQEVTAPLHEAYTRKMSAAAGALCKARTRKGKGEPCRIPAADGSDYCFAHAHCPKKGDGHLSAETSACTSCVEGHEDGPALPNPPPRRAGILVAIDDGVYDAKVCL